MDLIRQEGIIPSIKIASKRFIIIGAGSTGSLLTFCLAKMGVDDITVMDYDVVEEANIPNQLYRPEDIGKPKVDCLEEIIKSFTGIDIEPINLKVEEGTDLLPTLNTIMILTVDNIESRKIVYNKMKDYPILLIDTRMGGEGYSIRVIDLGSDDDKKEYEEDLKGKFKDLPCGQKAISYSIMSLASETTNIVKKILKEEDYEKLILREMPNYSYLSRKKEGRESR